LKQNQTLKSGTHDSGHHVGQDNIVFWGLDVHNPVFFISAITVLIFIGSVLLFPIQAGTILTDVRSSVLSNFDWLFVLATNIVFLFCLVLGVSPLGRIRLGGTDAQKEFSTPSWLAMLFSAGVGIGLVFYGAAEPVAYYTDWSGTPLNAVPLSDNAKQLSFSATIFHWGITPWAIYAVVGLSLAFFAFNKGLPLTVRSAFYPLFGRRVWGWPGHLIDISAVIATIFGLATSLGLGARQAASGLGFLFGLEASLGMQVSLIAAITALAVFSVVRGIDGGIKFLSNINMILAILLLAFVFAFGPTLNIIGNIFVNSVTYIRDIPALSNWIGREDIDWFHGWTIFYWAWWISWSPFVGMFIARISKGRTIREFLLAVIAIPTIFSIIWFSTFGTAALDQVDNGVGALPNGISDVSLVLFQMLENLPFAEISSFVGIVLLIVFFVTSSDSGSLVVDSITAGGKLHAPIPQRVFWAIMEGLVAIVLLVGGGAAALSSLQAGTIAAGLPFTIILFACCASLYRGLISEYRSIKNSVPNIQTH
jgi:BCCT family betaine/carnitine transporter